MSWVTANYSAGFDGPRRDCWRVVIAHDGQLSRTGACAGHVQLSEAQATELRRLLRATDFAAVTAAQTSVADDTPSFSLVVTDGSTSESFYAPAGRRKFWSQPRVLPARRLLDFIDHVSSHATNVA